MYILLLLLLLTPLLCYVQWIVDANPWYGIGALILTALVLYILMGMYAPCVGSPILSNGLSTTRC